MKGKQFKTNVYIVLTTLAVLAMGYYLYLEVYTKSKESHIIATRSRILEQMNRNLQTKVNTMAKNADEYVGYLIDSAKQSPQQDLFLLLDRKTHINYFNPNLDYVSSKKTGARIKVQNVKVLNVIPDAGTDHLVFNVALCDTSGKSLPDTIRFRARYDSLLSGFMQRNVFNDYILIIDSTILYSTLPGKPVLVFDKPDKDPSKESSASAKEVISDDWIDLTLRSMAVPAKIRGAGTYDVTVSNNRYKLFICQMEIRNKTWSVCGLVYSNRISQEKRDLAPWVIILIAMILILIILGLPFIKLRVLSPTEQLSSGTLVNGAVSLYLGISFIILFLLFGTNALWFVNENKTRLAGLANNIDSSFKDEINNSWDQLVSYDSVRSGYVRQEQNLESTASVLSSSSLRPGKYPYFDYVFWMDPTGQQTVILTPFSVRDKPSKLTSRDYFTKPQEWMLPGRDTCRFRMESIYSVTSGVVKAALSKTSGGKDPVIAMTGRFYSVIEPLIPGDYKFCIIDASGLVWFHSDKLRNLQENLITECNGDKSLSAAVYSNVRKTLDVSYYDEPYRIHIQPLTPMPLYLVTMYDKQAEHAYQVQTLLLTLLLFSSLVLFIIIEVLALFFLERFVNRPGRKSLIMDFTSAREKHSVIYIVLGVLSLLSTISYILLAGPLNELNPLLFAILTVSFLFPYSNYAITGFSSGSHGRTLFAIMNLVFIILINIISFRFMSPGDFCRILIHEGIMAALLVAGYLVLQRNLRLKRKGCDIRYYVFFLMCLLMVFSVAPSVKFFEASVNHEIVRGIKHDQLNLARQKEARNRQLKKYYGLMEEGHRFGGAVDSIFENRLRLGVYSEFNSTRIYVAGKNEWKGPDSACWKYIERNTVRSGHGAEYLLSRSRPAYNRTTVETKYLDDDTSPDSMQTWYQCRNKLVFDYWSASETYRADKPVRCTIVTDFRCPGTFTPFGPALVRNILFLLAVLGLIYCIYLLTLYGTKSMFGISILEKYSEYDFGKFIQERIRSGVPVMVIGSPSVDPEKVIRKSLAGRFCLKPFDILHLGKMQPERCDPSEKEVSVIRNFSFDFYSQKWFGMQMKMINEKLWNRELMVIICPTAPYVIQDYLESKVSGKEKEQAEEAPVTWEYLLMEYRNLLSAVSVLYTPEKYDQSIPDPDCYSKAECSNILQEFYEADFGRYFKCLICREVSASSYLQQFNLEILKYYAGCIKTVVDPRILEDRIISRMMELSRLYYDQLLASCDPMERFVLADLAHDMILNGKNQRTVNRLIIRGLIVANGCSLRFMNESFRRHVIYRISSEEKQRIREKLGDTGKSWQGYKIFLVLIMVGLLSFLFIANRDFLDNLNKLFIVLGGGLVLITNITGLLTKKGTGNNK